MQKKRTWLMGLTMVAGLAVVLRGMTTARKRRLWLKHRRGEGSAAEEGREIQPRPGDILLFHHIARPRDLLMTILWGAIMQAVTQHYDRHLGPVYSWMV